MSLTHTQKQKQKQTSQTTNISKQSAKKQTNKQTKKQKKITHHQSVDTLELNSWKKILYGTFRFTVFGCR